MCDQSAELFESDRVYSPLRLLLDYEGAQDHRSKGGDYKANWKKKEPVRIGESGDLARAEPGGDRAVGEALNGHQRIRRRDREPNPK